MRIGPYITMLIIALAPYAGHAAESELQWACETTQNCLKDALKLPLSAAEVKKITELTVELERLQEIYTQKASPQAGHEEAELGLTSQNVLALASDCMDIQDTHACKQPIEWVESIVKNIDFRNGMPPKTFPKYLDKKTVQYRPWSEKSREMVRRWVRGMLCTTKLSTQELSEFKGFVLHSSSCMDMLEWDIPPFQKFLRWLLNINQVCTNAAYDMYDHRIYYSADFILNSRISKNNGPFQDASLRIFEHEMAHHRAMKSKEGEAERDEFVALRKNKTRKELEARAAEALSDRFRTGKEAEVSYILKKLGIPVRWGSGSESVHKSGLLELSGMDLHALENSDEYYAVALELYRHDRELALEVYSKEELEWLARHVP